MADLVITNLWKIFCQFLTLRTKRLRVIPKVLTLAFQYVVLQSTKFENNSLALEITKFHEFCDKSYL